MVNSSLGLEGLKDDYRPASTTQESISSIRYDIQRFIKGLEQAFSYLPTQSCGSKHRAEQVYEGRIDEAMERVKAES